MTDQYALIAAHQKAHERQYRPMIYALLGAGWSMELPVAVENMARWRWAQPDKDGFPQRRWWFNSTDAAYSVLMRKRSAD